MPMMMSAFEICEFHKNTRILISQEQNIFSSIKKSLTARQGLLYGENSFVVEVTFKVT